MTGVTHCIQIQYHRFRNVAECRKVERGTYINKRRTRFVRRAQSLSQATSYLSGEKVMYLERDARHKPGKPVISR